MQALGVLADIIDRCQNHVLAGSRVRRHYLQHEFEEEKKAAWEMLGKKYAACFSMAAHRLTDASTNRKVFVRIHQLTTLSR